MKYIDFVFMYVWVCRNPCTWVMVGFTPNGSGTHRTAVWCREAEAIDFRDVAISPN